MDPTLRDILTAVREGRLDPAEAARGLRNQSAPAPDPSAPDPPSGSAWADVTDDVGASAGPSPTGAAPEAIVHSPVPVVVDDRPTTGLRIRAITRKVTVTGDPTVTTVAVVGPHELRREGSVLICESELDLPFGDPFAFLPTAMGRFGLRLPMPSSGRSPGRSHGRASAWGTDLDIRVNPTLDVELELTAGSLHVRDVGRLRARVTAGSARVEDVRGPLDLHVVGGTARVDTVMVGGGNRIRCDSGSVVLRLRPGSDVRFRPEAQLGRITIDGVEGGREITVGGGTGRLRAEVVMGSIQVEVPR